MQFLRTGLVVLLLAWLAAGLGCSREDTPAARYPAPASQADLLPTADEFRAALPREGGPAGYVGSAACRSCHEDQHASWHRSYHRTMTQYATPETVRADFHGITLTNSGTRFQLSERGGELWVRMEKLRVPTEAPEASQLLPTEAYEVRMGLVTGSHHMQVFWLPGGDGNTQIGFPFTWLIPEQRWVPRHTTFIRPPGMEHKAEIWNLVCSRCHATGIEPRVDPVARTADSRAGELGISCEACHGPGERHVAARRAAPAGGPAPAAATLAGEIVHPEKIDPARASQICGFCHSMKWIGDDEPWRQDGFRYRPGDDLEATTPIIRPAHIDRVPRLRAFLDRNPDLLNDFFWTDGMIRVSGREHNGLIDSPCYPAGKFSCLSCHSLHESEPDDLLAANRTDNRACTQCHEAFREPAALRAHTHHAPESAGSSCYNCHMPHTTYGVLKAIRSHQISSPRVADELATGRPNACNLCHLDQSLEWTARTLTEWYQQPAPALEAAHRGSADSVRLALSGDAGQRVLLAWHFSWPPALQASGTNWIPPVLGQLLDDPYAAVRCVAERSLRATSSLTPAGYDYTAEPKDRPAARTTVWEAWARLPSANPPQGGFPDQVLAPSGMSEGFEARFQPLLQRRNDQPLRLRE